MSVMRLRDSLLFMGAIAVMVGALLNAGNKDLEKSEARGR